MPSFLIDLPAMATAVILAAMPVPCPSAVPQVDIQVRIEHQEMPVVTGKTSRELTGEFLLNSDATTSTDGHWMVGGLNHADIGGNYSVQYEQHIHAQAGTACIAPQKVEFDIVYTSTIYMANNFKPVSCGYGATMAHQKRHIATDLRVLEKHIPNIRAALAKAAGAIGMRGPFTGDQLPAAREKIAEDIAIAADNAMQALREERRKRQAEIDTYDDYVRDTAACPGQFPKYDGDKN